MARDLRLRLSEGELRRLYLEEKWSLEDIARLYGVSRVAVWKYCKTERLKRRSRSKARLEAQKKGKVPQNYFKINERFFSKWSAEMAYILGLVATDGCISRSGVVSLSINDKELLEKVKGVMGSDHIIKSYNHQPNLQQLHFARERLVVDLSKLGILPKKSLNIKFPPVPNEYIKDFIRGVFDGDGSVYFDSRSSRHPVSTKFVSGSKDFIEGLECKLRTLGMPDRNIYQQRTKNGFSYMFRYGHNDSIKFFEILYYNTQENKLFLERKYNKFLEGFHLNNKKNGPESNRA